ncbi:hypothetical protein OM427_08830 [Halomonas sp. 18H]|uniref:hypothetical protein n=1 Tax=Halomonas almeriensis TaxID=308163 RepID=UPI0022316382|nr:MULTISPECIES: hypothetical protein [Halomonas]MCW4149633.1 hypothetical protein [Halomonas sp. 18H]MDN3553422.1 hypothetical protein [Halomonas almeriensis]
MPKRLPLTLWLLLLALPSGGSLAADTSPRAFEARYYLEVDGWPDADIQHRLEATASGWQSRMSATLPGMSGHEVGRFRVGEASLQAYYYASGYSLLGIKKSYKLDHQALATLPDRQSALFALARRAIERSCASTCRVDYVDHRGRKESVDYRVMGRRTLDLPAGEFEALQVEVTSADEDQRRLVFDFLPRLPGLLLSMTYYSDGQRKSRLEMTHLATP